MKKFLLFLLAVGLFASTQAIASNGELFTYNKQAVNTEFAELNAIENFVNQNDGITLSEMKSQNLDFANTISTFSLDSSAIIGPIGIPSFLWGCILGPVGVLIVYLIADDPKSEAKKAFWGCVIGSLLWGGGGIYAGR